jgi:hypothetical protein
MMQRGDEAAPDGVENRRIFDMIISGLQSGHCPAR